MAVRLAMGGSASRFGAHAAASSSATAAAAAAASAPVASRTRRSLATAAVHHDGDDVETVKPSSVGDNAVLLERGQRLLSNVDAAVRLQRTPGFWPAVLAFTQKDLAEGTFRVLTVGDRRAGSSAVVNALVGDRLEEAGEGFGLRLIRYGEHERVVANPDGSVEIRRNSEWLRQSKAELVHAYASEVLRRETASAAAATTVSHHRDRSDRGSGDESGAAAGAAAAAAASDSRTDPSLIHSSDLVVFVTDRVRRMGEANELAVLDLLRDRSTIYVVNQTDGCADEAEVAAVVADVRATVYDRTGKQNPLVVPLSARNAQVCVCVCVCVCVGAVEAASRVLVVCLLGCQALRNSGRCVFSLVLW